MPLSQELLNELKDILKEDFGEELNPKELFEVGNCLVSYFGLLAKIHSRNRLENKGSKKDNRKIDPSLEFDSGNKLL